MKSFLQFIFLLCVLGLPSFVQAQVKVAEWKNDHYEVVIDAYSLERFFTKMFSSDSLKVEPENFVIRSGVGNLAGHFLLFAQSRSQGGSCLMRVFLQEDAKHDLLIPNPILADACVNKDCDKCAFDEEGACFCSLRSEGNDRVVGCGYVLLMANRKPRGSETEKK
ncbi:MAG: hypothetical protein ACKVTZ_03240 [Bacteroidia bacterium]